MVVKDRMNKIMDEKTSIKKFGDLEVGDTILGADNQDVEVVRVYDEHIPERMFEIEMDNGEIIKASGNHLWYVETDFDLSFHRERKRLGKKHFGKLKQEIIDNLVGISESEDDIETGLMDVVNLCEVEMNNYEAINVLERIAESIGHIAENSSHYEDFLTGNIVEEAPKTNVRSYDAKLFVKQILSITGKRKFVKKYPLIVGRIMTTEQMLEYGDGLDIPVLKSLDK